MIYKYLGLLLFIFLVLSSVAQDSVVLNGYQRFYYPNGKISSEGPMRDGKPDRFWKTYSETGVIRSEGLRKHFELDSTWKFYNEKAQVNLIINYKSGKKSGLRYSYMVDKLVVDSFENDIKNHWSYIYFSKDTLQSKTFYKNGIEEGWSYQFSKEGRMVARTFYVNGFIRKRESFNSYDFQGRKEGEWKEFYENYNLKEVGYYRKGIRDGYFKYYDIDGNLAKIEKYRNGIIYDDAEEIAPYEIRIDYYEDGSIKVIGSYKDSLAEGIRREYSREGKLLDSYIMHKGVMVGHGIIDESGKKQGYWEFYYENGGLRGKGNYTNNVKNGEWVYFYQSGKMEQKGFYDQVGLINGEWIWFYENGATRIKEFYAEGEREGIFTEYTEDGILMAEGHYVKGSKEGDWIETVHGYIEQGSYLDNVPDGQWKYYYTTDTLYFEGLFIDGNADGFHIWYYRNGNPMVQGRYIMGLKEGDWKYYNESGDLSLRITFKDGIEVEYNAVKIEPELQISELE